MYIYMQQQKTYMSNNYISQHNMFASELKKPIIVYIQTLHSNAAMTKRNKVMYRKS